MARKVKLSSVTRREFFQASAGLAAFASCNAGWSAMVTSERRFEHGNPLNEFSYGDVQFEPGVHQSQLEQTVAILLGLDEESMLRPFRLLSGLPAPGFELEGWYSSNGIGPGHSFGQWISALSRYYAITRDEKAQQKVFRLVQAYGDTIDSQGTFFKRYPSPPNYVYDKLVCGLIDAHEFAKHPDALSILAKTTQAALPYLPANACTGEHTEGDASYMICAENYTIPENQLIAWQRGAQPDHLKLAQRYDYTAFFDPLARGENVLGDRHAYSHVNSLCSAAKADLVFGDEKHLDAARNGFNFLEQQSWATGAWGVWESLLPIPRKTYPDFRIDVPPIKSLGQGLDALQWHFETPCGSYAHFKLTRYLLRITKEARYGDSMERIMYNTVLGALPLNKFGKAFYQSNYHSHARKQYFDGYGNGEADAWPCCSGTLPQVAADYHISAYFHDKDGPFINLYIPSTLRWEQQGSQIALAQSGQYPLGNSVQIEITASRPVQMAIRLRIPSWARESSIRVNGKKIPATVVSGTFATIRREWKSGDRIDLDLPRSLALVSIDSERPDTVALVCGPLVLFAISDDTPKVTRAHLLSAKQQGAGGAEWVADSENGRLRFLPFWVIRNETYFTYMQV
jgi:DUF1680 family protein